MRIHPQTSTGGRPLTSPKTGETMDPFFLPNRLVRTRVLEYIDEKHKAREQGKTER